MESKVLAKCLVYALVKNSKTPSRMIDANVSPQCTLELMKMVLLSWKRSGPSPPSGYKTLLGDGSGILSP